MAVNFSFTVSIAFQKDSLDMTAADRDMLREQVLSCTENHVLITHGTDSMVASALTLIDIPDKCIVLTGAMKPAAFINSDAEFVASDRTGNIYGAHVPGQALVKHERVR